MAEQCAKLETEVGNIELEFFPETSPETVRNFLNLIALKFYDTTLFTRVVPNFVVQGGNFGSRLDKPYELYERSRRNIKDEPSLVKHERGIISMARGDEPTVPRHIFLFWCVMRHFWMANLLLLGVSRAEWTSLTTSTKCPLSKKNPKNRCAC